MNLNVMELSEDEIIKWMTIINETDSSAESDSCRKTSECLRKLTIILDQLHSFLVVELRSPVELLHSIPSLAKFLSTLCSNSFFLCSEVLYKKLMSCVLSFYTNLPCQRSVSAWTMSQLKHTVSAVPLLNSSVHTMVADIIGSSPLENSIQLQINLIKMIQSELQRLPSFQWDESARAVLPLCLLPGKVLRAISESCLPIVHSPNVTQLIESLLCCQAACDILEKQSFPGQSHSGEGLGYVQRPALSPLFLEAVSKAQENRYKRNKTGVVNLSYDALVSLWLQHLPSFENEVMNLIEAYLDESNTFTDVTFVKELINSRQLPKACSSHVQLHCIVNNLLSQLLVNCGSCDCVQKFINYFVECLHDN